MRQLKKNDGKKEVVANYRDFLDKNLKILMAKLILLRSRLLKPVIIEKLDFETEQLVEKILNVSNEKITNEFNEKFGDQQDQYLIQTLKQEKVKVEDQYIPVNDQHFVRPAYNETTAAANKKMIKSLTDSAKEYAKRNRTSSFKNEELSLFKRRMVTAFIQQLEALKVDRSIIGQETKLKEEINRLKNNLNTLNVIIEEISEKIDLEKLTLNNIPVEKNLLANFFSRLLVNGFVETTAKANTAPAEKPQSAEIKSANTKSANTSSTEKKLPSNYYDLQNQIMKRLEIHEKNINRKYIGKHYHLFFSSRLNRLINSFDKTLNNKPTVEKITLYPKN